jgi:hypothetical protein
MFEKADVPHFSTNSPFSSNFSFQFTVSPVALANFAANLSQATGNG